MNYPCASCTFSCSSCNRPPVSCPQVQQSCCVSCERSLEPLLPANTISTRPQVKKPNPKCIPNRKPPQRCPKVKNCPKPVEPAVDDDCEDERPHPSDCACSKCDKCNDPRAECANKNRISQTTSYCDTEEMANPSCERNMKNYMHDNPQFSETKNSKKSSTCGDLIDCIGPNQEVWVLQCPKGFDPKTIMNTELGKIQKESKGTVDLTACRFQEKVSFACLTPAKAAEYEAICDSIKMIRPVGKIIVRQSQHNLQPKRSKSSIKQEPDACSDIENINECCEDMDMPSSSASKKIKKKFNDQKFTIETTVTVENCGDRKKNKKLKQESCGECLPLVPPEPIVPKKKQKKKDRCSSDEDLSWLNC